MRACILRSQDCEERLRQGKLERCVGRSESTDRHAMDFSRELISVFEVGFIVNVATTTKVTDLERVDRDCEEQVLNY